MPERSVNVTIDEAEIKDGESSYLRVKISSEDGEPVFLSFVRGTSPQQISDVLYEIARYFEDDEEAKLLLSEENRQNIIDLFTEASHNVPGLG